MAVICHTNESLFLKWPEIFMFLNFVAAYNLRKYNSKYQMGKAVNKMGEKKKSEICLYTKYYQEDWLWDRPIPLKLVVYEPGNLT